MKFLSNTFRKFFEWLYSDELKNLNNSIERLKILSESNQRKYNQLNTLIQGVDVSVDVNIRSNSWACISIQGKNQDFIKFVDLGDSDIREIQRFLSIYDRRKVDASPQFGKMFSYKKGF